MPQNLGEWDDEPRVTQRPGALSPTIRYLFFEALERCSPELYTKHAIVNEWVMLAYMHGIGMQSLRNITCVRWLRYCQLKFIHSYLRERRAGTPARKPGPPPEMYAEVQRLRERFEGYRP